MDHQLALSTQAVERYTLGELTSPQREEFEEHFFDCPECAAALREFESFAINTRAVFTEEEAEAKAPAPVPVAYVQPGWGQRFGNWLGVRTLVPASAIALGILAFVSLRAPQTVSGATFSWTMAPDVRDEVERETITPNTDWLAPTIDLLPGANHPNRWAVYHWEVRTAADDRVVASGDGHDGGEKLALKIDASKFDSGKAYRLVVQGEPGTSPESASFVIDRK